MNNRWAQLQLTAAKTVRAKAPSPKLRHSRFGILIPSQRTFIMSSQMRLIQKRLQVGSPTSYHTLSNGGLTHFAHKLVARNHQRKPLVVARILAFAHRELPRTRGLSFYSSCRNFVFAAHVSRNARWIMKSVFREVFSQGYFHRAREHARRRKSPWNLVLIIVGFVLMPLISYTLFRGMWLIHTLFYPEHVGLLNGFFKYAHGGLVLLFTIPLFFAAIPIALILANLIAWCIPLMRNGFDSEAKGVERDSFKEAMVDLVRFGLLITTISLLLSFIGAFLLADW